MGDPELVRVAAPGLPPFPPLMYDGKQRRAVVFARHATWHGHEWAIRTSMIFTIVMTCSVVIAAWQLVPGIRTVEGVFLLILATAMCHVGIGRLVHESLRPFLARRIFASNTAIWFTTRAIAFRSRLYDRPVVIWREWRGLPVLVRFIVEPDRNAQSYLRYVQSSGKQPTEHLHEAMVLKLVLMTANTTRPFDAPSESSILRTIPITEIDGAVATRFTVVSAAGAMLTALTQRQSKRTRRGEDIDTV
jgi:hypothetical protein